MRTVTVNVERRNSFVSIDRVGCLRAFDEIACADQFVIAVLFRKTITCLAGTVPIFRRLEIKYVILLVEAITQPTAKQAGPCPAVLAKPRSVRFSSLTQRRMVYRDTAVYHTNDDALAIKAERTSQAAVPIEEAKKPRAISRSKRPDFVFPYFQYAIVAAQFVGLYRRHARGKTVQAVSIAVDLVD